MTDWVLGRAVLQSVGYADVWKTKRPVKKSADR